MGAEDGAEQTPLEEMYAEAEQEALRAYLKVVKSRLDNLDLETLDMGGLNIGGITMFNLSCLHIKFGPIPTKGGSKDSSGKPH
jgi:hypothetical protein